MQYVIQLVSWLPADLQTVVVAAAGVVGVLVILRVIKLIWDVIPLL